MNHNKNSTFLRLDAIDRYVIECLALGGKPDLAARLCVPFFFAIVVCAGEEKKKSLIEKMTMFFL
jgi:hypothetical protein